MTRSFNELSATFPMACPSIIVCWGETVDAPLCFLRAGRSDSSFTQALVSTFIETLVSFCRYLKGV